MGKKRAASSRPNRKLGVESLESRRVMAFEAVLVEDSIPEPGLFAPNGSSSPENFTVVDGTGYFTAEDGIHGRQIWKINASGKAEVLDFQTPWSTERAGIAAPDIANRISIDEWGIHAGRLYLIVRQAPDGNPKLWGVSGSNNLEEVKRPTSSTVPELVSLSNPKNLLTVNGSLYFTASDSNGTRLWTIGSDGNAVALFDTHSIWVYPVLNPIPPTLQQHGLIYTDGAFFFAGTEGQKISENELWRYTPGGLPELVEDDIPGSGIGAGEQGANPIILGRSNGSLYFAADDGVNGRELWKVGLTGTAEMVEDAIPGGGIAEGSQSAIAGPLSMLVGDGVNTYFNSGAVSATKGLWRVDSSGRATQVEIYDKDGARNDDWGTDIRSIVDFNGTVYFVTRTFRLFRVDADGKAKEVPIEAIGYGMSPVVSGNFLYLNYENYNSFNPSSHGKVQRINSNHVVETVNFLMPGVGLPVDPKGKVDAGIFPKNIVPMNGTVFFAANDGANGTELWRIGSSGTPEMVEDSIPGTGINNVDFGSNPEFLVGANGKVYFEASANRSERHAWSINGQGLAERSSIKQHGYIFQNQTRYDYPSIWINGAAYFWAHGSLENGQSGLGIWRLDPSGKLEKGNWQLGYLGSTHGEMRFLEVNGIRYWAHPDIYLYSHSASIFKMEPNGSIGDVAFHDLPLSIEEASIHNMRNIGGRLSFQLSQSRFNPSKSLYELVTEHWRLDETGTARKVPEDHLELLRALDNGIFVDHDKFYLPTTGLENSYDLWKINATGDVQLVERALPGGSIYSKLMNGRLKASGTWYFRSDTADNRNELWRLNERGIAEKVLYSDEASPLAQNRDVKFLHESLANPTTNLDSIDRNLYFSAFDEQNGLEIWRVGSDGKSYMVEDDTLDGGLNPGSASTSFEFPVEIGGLVYFLGSVGSKQIGLWCITPDGKAKLLKVISPEESQLTHADYANYYRLFSSNGTLYFTARDATNGLELWRVRGIDTPELVNASNGGIAPGSMSSDPDNIIDANGTVYFVASKFVTRDGVSLPDLWRVVDPFRSERENTDFGDAPISAQSGLKSSFPTSIESDGARHRIGSVYLGTKIDAERDGQSSRFANGESRNGVHDDDGVTFDSLLMTSESQAMNATIGVVASQAAKLDAWIDFNGDGDWDDAGEKIIDSLAMSMGSNRVPFSIPAAAKPGVTYARFRLSTSGGLAPTGLANDGEVEDYRIHMVASAAQVDLDTLPSYDFQGLRELDFSQGGKHRVKIQDAKLFATNEGKSLKFVVDDEELDVAPGWKHQRSEQIGGQWIHRFLLGESALEIQSPRSIHNFVDRFDVNGNGTIEPIDILVVINKLVQQSRSGSTSGGGDDATTTRDHWFFFDVDGNGSVDPIDVLQIINAIRRRSPNTTLGEGEQEPYSNQTVVDSLMSLELSSFSEMQKKNKRVAS